jgi:hypothetical protein
MRGFGILVLTFCLGLAAQPAFAAEQDGRWAGAAPVAGSCAYASAVTLQVANGAVHGLVRNPNALAAIYGVVDPEGTGNFTVDGNLHGTLRFVDGHLILDWNNGACPRHAELLHDTAPVPGPFDGAWQAERLAMAKPCNASTWLRMVVVGSSVMGELYAPWRNARFNADIGADGTGKMEMEGAHGSIRFQGDRFEIAWVGGRCGAEVALGDRVPDAAGLAAMLKARQKGQADFQALTAAALAGGKTDYTALRAASVHGGEWAFYNNKADGPMSQAALAAKGGDCAQALTNLELAIRYDFTIDSAHALKADCLRKSDPRTARIEDAIANGLVRSLMRSGDGKSEKTAYVVTTGREMADVLANRKIEVKTRQTEIRGSDGHYYAMVQGVTVNGAKGKMQTVYFNVDAFVVGRQSKRADGASTP